MMLDIEMDIPTPVPTDADPFAIGWRYVTGPDNSLQIPLTKDDLLDPREDDFVVNNLAHHDDRSYLMEICRHRIAKRSDLRVFCDHRIDFQNAAIQTYLGPDVIAFQGEPRDWNPRNSVFPVKMMDCRPLFAVEIASPTTRQIDLGEKTNLYFTAGIPFYVIVDLPYGGGKRPNGIVALQAGPTGYKRLACESNGRVRLEVVDIDLGVENERLVIYDRSGVKLDDYVALCRRLESTKSRLEALGKTTVTAT